MTPQKTLKAVMCLHGLAYRRTHDLEELAGVLVGALLAWAEAEIASNRDLP